jgi:hypothetical protein
MFLAGRHRHDDNHSKLEQYDCEMENLQYVGDLLGKMRVSHSNANLNPCNTHATRMQHEEESLDKTGVDSDEET